MKSTAPEFIAVEVGDGSKWMRPDNGCYSCDVYGPRCPVHDAAWAKIVETSDDGFVVELKNGRRWRRTADGWGQLTDVDRSSWSPRERQTPLDPRHEKPSW